MFNKQYLNKLIIVFNKCRKSDSFIIIVILRFCFYRVFYDKRIFPHQNVKIRGVGNLDIKGTLEVGIGYNGVVCKSDKTYLNINGKLVINGDYSIGRGCRFDIGKNANVSIGNRGYINFNTKLIIMHGLKIGDNCVISWDCQFLDEDFHEIKYHMKQNSDNQIIIGDNVWIGCGVKIYNGVNIPNGCVIASNSIVIRGFYESNLLIGGHPADIIRREISWI